MLKILVPVTYGELGGSQVFLLKLIDAMAADSPVHFSCWLFRKGPLEEEMRKRNIPCRIMPFSPKNPFFLLFMIRELRKEHPDVIYLHASRFIALAARLAHVPCVERINMSRNMSVRGWCSFPWLDRLFTSFNTKALAVSDAIRRQLLARGIPDSRICIIRNFVEPDRFRRPPAAQRRRLREELGLSDRSIAVLNAGRFMPQKAQSDYLRIASLALKQVPDLRFFLLGDGELKEKLQQETGELGIQDSVVFLPFRKDVESVYGAMDILLHTAHWEPLANVLLEGMAASLAILASDVDGTSEVIHEGRTGLLFPKGDIQAGARGLIRLAENPALREKLGNEARNYVEGHHSVEVVVKQYKKLFSELGS